MEVHWDDAGNFLYSPKLREWSYLAWFQQILKAAREQACTLEITAETIWINIPEALKNEMIRHSKT